MLSPEAREKWLSMIRQHARALEQDLAALHQELRPIFEVTPASQPQTEIVTDDASLVRAIDRLAELCSENETVIRSAFTTSPDTSRAQGLKTAQFWNSFKKAETLVAEIQKQ